MPPFYAESHRCSLSVAFSTEFLPPHNFLPLVSKMQFTCVSLLLLFVTTAVATELWRPTRSVKNPSTVQVTNADQLWRFQVGPGNDGVSIGTRYLAFLGSNLRFVNTYSGGDTYADGRQCGEEDRHELYDMGGGVFAIKNVARQKWWSCPGDGKLRAVDKLSATEAFKLYIDETGDNLEFRRADGTNSFYVYLWPNLKIYCRDVSQYYRGRHRFIGWKGGDREWKASDSWFTITQFDNRAGRSAITAEFEHVTGTSLEKESTRGGSFSTSASATASFFSIFEMDIKSSIGFDWSSVERSTFSERRTEKVTVTVEPGTSFKIQEAVGKYGPISIFSGSLRYLVEAVEEVDAEASEIYPTT